MMRADDSVAHGWQSWLRRWRGVESFLDRSAHFCEAADAVRLGRRKLIIVMSDRDDVKTHARTSLRSGRGQVQLLSVR